MTNPVNVAGRTREREKTNARCGACEHRFAVDSAEVVAELPLHRAGMQLADVALLDAGHQPPVVREAVEMNPELAFEVPMTLASEVSLEAANGMADAYRKLGATVEIRTDDRDPRWDSAPRLELTD